MCYNTESDGCERDKNQEVISVNDDADDDDDNYFLLTSSSFLSFWTIDEIKRRYLYIEKKKWRGEIMRCAMADQPSATSHPGRCDFKNSHYTLTALESCFPSGLFPPSPHPHFLNQFSHRNHRVKVIVCRCKNY